MDIINSTNRAILFEEINPQVPGMLSVIPDVRDKDSLTDDQIREINNQLLCTSYQDFLDKLSPTVYSFFNAANQKVVYTLEKPENVPDDLITQIPLNSQNSFLKMLETLIETKRSQGIRNVDFKFENILDMISPKKVMDDIRLLRKTMVYTYEKYAQLEDGDPKKLDIGDELNVLFEDASNNYSNIMAMLPIAIEDIKTRLLLTSTGNEEEPTKLLLGTLQIGNDGELKILEAPKTEESTALAQLEDKTREGLVSVLREDYDAVCEDAASDYVRDLVVRTFAPLSPGTNSTSLNVPAEVKAYNTMLDFYRQSQSEFIKVVRPLIEKLLGVRMFFEQYTVKKRGMKPTLLVANEKPEMLAKSGNLPKLIAYLNTVNGKNTYDDAVWFGIIPNVALDRKSEVKVKRQRFQGNVETENTDVNSLESVIRIIDAVKDYRVQVFFSFETNPKATFDYMATEGIGVYQDRCQPMVGKPYSEFAIPCIPNITIIPKDKSGVILDKKMVVSGEAGEETAKLSDEQEDIAKLWIEGIYVGAAYIAAGLVSAWQDPAFLKQQLRKRVAPNLPGVRFDIEADDHALRVPTSMSLEITGFTNTVKAAINSQNFGFIFASESAKVEGKPLNNITVYKARSLMFNEDYNTFEPIFKTLHATYIQRILRFLTQDFKEDNIKRFFSTSPDSQKSLWAAERECYNSILEVGDDITYTIDEDANICIVDISYKGVIKNLEVDMSRSIAVG